MSPARVADDDLRTAVLTWYDSRGRVFPFRASRDPWAILVSEAMAQQTQIARVTAKWSEFMAAFPTVHAVAAATPADILRAWQGLGYNRRALSLWRAARATVDEHDGDVPDDLAALERLPGVGPYTARAVAAIAFGRPVGAVDTNVRRVLGRVSGEAMSNRELQALADAFVPPGRAADWTHAVMDIGATFCRPRAPRCGDCPAAPWCRFPAATARDPGSTRRSSEPPFASTSRWLRGRILERLRTAADGAWLVIPARIGGHGSRSVGTALAALHRDGLVELDPTHPRRARLPLG